MTRIFCLVGKTGAGKSTYLDELMNDKSEDKLDLKPLVYGTTRAPRDNEVNGKDYYFYTQEEYEAIERKKFIECRVYNTKDNGDSRYFTLSDYIEDGNNYICAASVEQIIAYMQYFKGTNTKIYVINIACSVITRMARIIAGRIKTDNQALELCRRILKEDEEYEKLDIVLASMDSKKYITINNEYDNFNDSHKSIVNIIQLKGYIRDCCLDNKLFTP